MKAETLHHEEDTSCRLLKERECVLSPHCHSLLLDVSVQGANCIFETVLKEKSCGGQCLFCTAFYIKMDICSSLRLTS